MEQTMVTDSDGYLLIGLKYITLMAHQARYYPPVS